MPARDGGVVLIVLGKGNRMRRVRVNAETWSLVVRLRGSKHSSKTSISLGGQKRPSRDAPLTARQVGYKLSLG